MEINITGRNIHLDDSIKAYVHKRLDKLEKLYRRIYKCEVILETEKAHHNTEVIMYLKRNRVVSKESSPDMYASIDLASESAKKQLRRLHDRLSSRRRRVVLRRIMSPVGGRSRSIEEDILVPEERGEIITESFSHEEPISPKEARLQLEMQGKVFLVFKNVDTGEKNVLYKKADGNYGLIEPKF